MPTKPGALSSFFRKAGKPLNLIPGPTTSLLSLELKEGILTNPSKGRPIAYSIRTLHLSADIPVIYNWMRKQYANSLAERKAPPAELKMSYAAMLESDFSQPFIGFAGDLPICQLDLYQVNMDAISLNYPAEPNDYGLNVLLAPLVIQDQVATLLKMWLEYFFSFPEVKRLIIDIEAGDEWQDTLFERVGFRFSRKIKLPYKKADLYVCTRESYSTVSF